MKRVVVTKCVKDKLFMFENEMKIVKSPGPWSGPQKISKLKNVVVGSSCP